MGLGSCGGATQKSVNRSRSSKCAAPSALSAMGIKSVQSSRKTSQDIANLEEVMEADAIPEHKPGAYGKCSCGFDPTTMVFKTGSRRTCAIEKHWRQCKGSGPPAMSKPQHNARYRYAWQSIKANKMQTAKDDYVAWRSKQHKMIQDSMCDINLDDVHLRPVAKGMSTEYRCPRCMCFKTPAAAKITPCSKRTNNYTRKQITRRLKGKEYVQHIAEVSRKFEATRKDYRSALQKKRVLRRRIAAAKAASDACKGGAAEFTEGKAAARKGGAAEFTEGKVATQSQ